MLRWSAHLLREDVYIAQVQRGPQRSLSVSTSLAHHDAISRLHPFRYHSFHPNPTMQQSR
jgi:hypothetical protein